VLAALGAEEEEEEVAEFVDLVVLVEEGESWRGGEARRFFSPNCFGESTRLRFFDPAVDGADIVVCFILFREPVMATVFGCVDRFG